MASCLLLVNNIFRHSILRRTQLIIAISLVAIIAGVALATIMHKPARLPLIDPNEPAPVMDQDGKPHMRGITYTHVEEGVRKWTLTASGAKQDPAKEEFELANVKVDFFPKGGGKVTLRGDTGTYIRGERIVVLKGNVVGTTHDGMRLVTDSLTYTDADQVVTTTDPVKITGTDFSLDAVGMKVFVPEDKILFEKNVKSTFIPSGDGPPPGATVD